MEKDFEPQFPRPLPPRPSPLCFPFEHQPSSSLPLRVAKLRVDVSSCTCVLTKTVDAHGDFFYNTYSKHVSVEMARTLTTLRQNIQTFIYFLSQARCRLQNNNRFR